MKKFLLRIKKWYQSLPDKKRHIEFLAAILSIPMTLTILYVNLLNINNQKKTIATPTSTPIQIVISGSLNPPPQQSTNSANKITPTTTPTITPTVTPTPTSSPCLKDIGPIEILSPQESEIITDSNFCIQISTDSKYCPVTWSYQLNNGDWSNYTQNDICLYNLSSGQKQLNLKIKSTVTDKTITLQRNFIYQNPSTTPTASTSATSTN